ncbi:hypothetical protein ACFLY2_03300 [Patescibacteria group bacterium]
MRNFLKNKYKTSDKAQDDIKNIREEIVSPEKEATILKNKKLVEEYREDYIKTKKRLELEKLERRYRLELLQKNTKEKALSILNNSLVNEKEDPNKIILKNTEKKEETKNEFFINYQNNVDFINSLPIEKK